MINIQRAIERGADDAYGKDIIFSIRSRRDAAMILKRGGFDL